MFDDARALWEGLKKPVKIVVAAVAVFLVLGALSAAFGAECSIKTKYTPPVNMCVYTPGERVFTPDSFEEFLTEHDLSPVMQITANEGSASGLPGGTPVWIYADDNYLHVVSFSRVDGQVSMVAETTQPGPSL